MKTQIRILVALAMIASAACSKKKEEVVPVPLPGSTSGYSSLDDFEQDVKLVPQTFQLDNVSGGVITGAEGTQLTFPANAFIHQNGSPVTGNVTIALYEANKKSEMVLGGIYTTTATVPLISGGQFKFVAVQNGEQVKFAPGKKASFVIPSANPDNNMTAYVENTSAPNFNYTFPTDSSSGLFSNGTEYVGFTNTMTWFNCDHPFIQATYKTLTLNKDPAFESGTCKTFLVMKSVNVVVCFFNTNSSAFTYSYAPQGYEVSLVAIGIKNGKLYSTFMPITIVNDQTINMTLSETTTEQFKTQLNTLN